MNEVVELCHMFGRKSKYKFSPGLDLDFMRMNTTSLFDFILKVSRSLSFLIQE